MDLFSFGFVLLIMAASGGIAYAADILGKKLGKKRMSLRFGRVNIRPKHVASLGTAGMGVIVSLLTILFIALVSRDAREWLIQGRGLLVEQERLKREIRGLEDQRQEAESTKVAITKDLAGVRTRLADTQGEVQKQRGALDDIRKKRDGLTTEVSRLTGQVASISVDLRRSQGEFRRSQTSLRSANAQLALFEGQVAAAKRSLAIARNNLGVTETSLSYFKKQTQDAVKKSYETYLKSQELQKQVDDLGETAKTRELQVAQLQKDTNDLIAQRNDAERQVDAVLARYADARAKLEQAGEELAELQGIAQSQYLFLATTFRTSRLEALTYRAGEEVARTLLPRGADADAATRAVASLLRAARIEATARGAKPKKDDGKTAYEVADVFGHQDPKTGTVATGADLKQAVVSRAAGRDEDQVLVATSSLNAFAGEPVSLEINVVPNPVVYRRREMVADARIDGSLDEDRILDQISDFVRGRVRERARQDHMIPRAGTDAPFGEVKTSEVLALVREVKKVGRSVLVQAFAGEETRAADPLRLEFRVR